MNYRADVKQGSAPEERTRALEHDLMARVADETLVAALRRVCTTKRSAGLDQMSATELKAWFSQRTHGEKLKEQLPSGIYEPALVRGVQIPKPGGKGMRQLGFNQPRGNSGTAYSVVCQLSRIPFSK